MSDKKYLLKGAKAICDAVGENRRNIKTLVEKEGLPAWKRSGGQWRAQSEHLAQWAKDQDEKYCGEAAT